MSGNSCACCDTSSAVEPAPGDLTCYCPLEGVIDTVAKKYALDVIALLGANGPMRFGELSDRLAVTSSSTFSTRLEELVDESLIERRSFDEVPPRVEYSLTPRGRELEERIRPLLDWASREA